MARHKKGRIPWLGIRRSYRQLSAAYSELLSEYRALSADHQLILRETAAEELEPLVPAPGQTSWGARREAQEADEPVPVITGLDPDKAFALLRNSDLLESPSGAWRVEWPENG